MTFEEFSKEIKDNILDYLPSECADYCVSVRSILKNNGIRLKGLIIEGQDDASPTIYLEPYYKMWSQGTDMNTVMKGIADTYQRTRYVENPFKTKTFEYKNIKDRLFTQAINVQKNEELLKNVPHEQIGDIALVYRAMFFLGDNCGHASMLVERAHMGLLAVSEEELKEQAIANMRKLYPMELKSINQAMRCIAQRNDLQDMEIPSEGMGEEDVFVLTNKEEFHAAAYLFDDKILSEIADKVGGNFRVVPLSIDECIVLSENADFGLDFIRESLHVVNSMYYQPDELYLSDMIYYYNAQEHVLSEAEDMEQKADLNMDM